MAHVALWADLFLSTLKKKKDITTINILKKKYEILVIDLIGFNKLD
jgi:hypothetical protein